jgi:hypothetical protein
MINFLYDKIREIWIFVSKDRTRLEISSHSEEKIPSNYYLFHCIALPSFYIQHLYIPSAHHHTLTPALEASASHRPTSTQSHIAADHPVTPQLSSTRCRHTPHHSMNHAYAHHTTISEDLFLNCPPRLLSAVNQTPPCPNLAFMLQICDEMKSCLPEIG